MWLVLSAFICQRLSTPGQIPELTASDKQGQAAAPPEPRDFMLPQCASSCTMLPKCVSWYSAFAAYLSL